MHAIDPFDRDVTAALLAVAGRDGWSATTMAATAAEAGCSLAALRARFGSREAVLLRFLTLVDAAVLATPATGDTPREKLFDVLMRRFDTLQPHRAGVLAVAAAAPGDPCLLATGAPAAVRSMAWMLDAAGLPSSGITGQLRAKALLALWLAVFRAWAKDETADMAATMAALDRMLDRAEGLARMLEPLLPGGAPQPPQPTGETPAGPAGDGMPA